MKILRSTILSGCNVHGPRSVAQLDLDPGPLTRLSSRDAGADFAERFAERFATLPTYYPPPPGAMPREFLERLRSADGVPFPEVLLRAIVAVDLALLLKMQRHSGVELSRVLPGPVEDSIRIVWRTRVPRTSRRAARVACLGVNELLPEHLRDPSMKGTFDEALAVASARARRRPLAPSTGYLVLAAEEEGIPYSLMGGGFLRLGLGREQRVLWGSVTDRTPFVGCRMSLGKRVTNRVLAELGLPVPRQRNASSVETATAAAERIGYPVVLKPAKGKKGHGVAVGIRNAEELAVAYERANSRRVVVESFVAGHDHRLLVIDGKFTAAVKRLPPQVTGDGGRTVLQLIEELNRDPRRDGIRRCQVQLDHEVDRQLERAGFDREDVLPVGVTVSLRGMANVSTGGSAHDVTDRVHPDNRAMAVRAIEVMGLDIGAVDFLTPDIGVSYREAGGIIELNSRPGLRLHTFPDSGRHRDVAKPFFEMLFPPSERRGRVPIALLVGDRGRRPVARTLRRILRADRPGVGVVFGKGARLDGSRITPGDRSAARALDTLLRHPRADRIVRLVSAGNVARRGLRHDGCRVAALLPIDQPGQEDEHLGLGVVARSAERFVVADHDVAGRAALQGVDARRITLVAATADTPGLRDHLDAGGRVVTVGQERGGRTIVMARGGKRLTRLGPAPEAGAPGPDLFAAAIAHALEVRPRTIRRALRRHRSATAATAAAASPPSTPGPPRTDGRHAAPPRPSPKVPV